jgi:hypothetical protein
MRLSNLMGGQQRKRMAACHQSSATLDRRPRLGLHNRHSPQFHRTAPSRRIYKDRIVGDFAANGIPRHINGGLASRNNPLRSGSFAMSGRLNQLRRFIEAAYAI